MAHDVASLPSTRSEALRLGVNRYFTGIACTNGHVEVRAAKNGHCLQCDRDRQKHRLTNDPEYRELHRKSCLKRAKARLADPAQKQKIRARERELHHASESRKAKKAAADKIRNQREEVKSRRRELQRIRYVEIQANDPEYVAARRVRGAEWAKVNKERCNAKTASRRAARNKASPPWLTPEMKAQIQEFYNLAREKSEQSGVPHEVDHVVPLKSDVVCGLHVPWNLQVLTEADNRAKANKIFEV